MSRITPGEQPQLEGQLDLFAIEVPAVAPITEDQRDRDQRARWGSYSGPRACHDCITYLHEHGGIGPNPKRGRRRRSVKATGEDTVYCQPHAEKREPQTAVDRKAAAAKAAKTRAANKARAERAA